MNNLNSLRMVELYKIASELKIKNYKQIKKAELVQVIFNAQEANKMTKLDILGLCSETPTIVESYLTILGAFIIDYISETPTIVESYCKETKLEKVYPTNIKEMETTNPQPLNFFFDSNRANVGDKFRKRVGDEYIPMTVVAKDDKQTVLQARNGIKIKLKK